MSQLKPFIRLQGQPSFHPHFIIVCQAELLLFGVLLMMKGMDKFTDSIETNSASDRSHLIAF